MPPHHVADYKDRGVCHGIRHRKVDVHLNSVPKNAQCHKEDTPEKRRAGKENRGCDGEEYTAQRRAKDGVKRSWHLDGER